MDELKDHLFDQWEQANIEVERLNCVNQELRDELLRLKTKYQATKRLQCSTSEHNSKLAAYIECLEGDINRLTDNGEYVLVPKEPTQRMLNAGHIVMNPIKGSDVHPGTNQKRRDCYKAMIEAYLKYGDEPKEINKKGA